MKYSPYSNNKELADKARKLKEPEPPKINTYSNNKELADKARKLIAEAEAGPKFDKLTIGNFIATMDKSGETMLEVGFGVKTPLAFSYEELEKIEAQFVEMFQPDRPGGLHPTSIWSFGWYFGRVILANIPGAEWTNLDGENPWDMEVSVPSKQVESLISKDDTNGAKFTCFPARRVGKMFKNPKEDKMTSMFRLLVLQANYTTTELLKMGTPMEDGWYLFPGGDMIRISRAAGEEDQKKKHPHDLPPEKMRPIGLNEEGTLSISETPLTTYDSPETAARKIREEKSRRAAEADKAVERKTKVRGKESYKF